MITYFQYQLELRWVRLTNPLKVFFFETKRKLLRKVPILNKNGIINNTKFVWILVNKDYKFLGVFDTYEIAQREAKYYWNFTPAERVEIHTVEFHRS